MTSKHSFSHDFLMGLAGTRHVAVREYDGQVVFSMGQAIRSLSLTDDAATPAEEAPGGATLTIINGRPYKAPEAGSIMRPLLSRLADTTVISSGGSMSRESDFEVSIIKQDGWQPQINGNSDDDGRRKHFKTSNLRLPRVQLPGVFATEPVRSLLGHLDSGDVRYDGMNEAETEIQTAIARRLLEVVEVPDFYRTGNVRLQISRSLTGSGARIHEIAETVPRRVINGVAAIYSAPRSLVDTGIADQIAATCRAKMTRPGKRISSLIIRFDKPDLPKFVTNRILTRKISGARTSGSTIVEKATTDHPVNNVPLVSPVSS